MRTASYLSQVENALAPLLYRGAHLENFVCAQMFVWHFDLQDFGFAEVCLQQFNGCQSRFRALGSGRQVANITI